MPRKKKTADEGADIAEPFNMDLFPEVPEDYRPRRVFFRALRPSVAEGLIERGYEPIDLMTLPRRNELENRQYLMAKAQAIEEGTVFAEGEDRQQLTLSMQANQMLNPKSTHLNINVDAKPDDLASVLGWQQSRHTLRGNTTVVAQLAAKDPQKLQEETESRLDKARKKAEKKVRGLRAATAKATGKKRVKKNGKR